MSLVPLRRAEIVQEPEHDPNDVTVTVGDNGLIQIEFGSSKPQKKPKVSDRDKFDRNLAEDMDDTALAALASYLIEGIEADEEARRDWEDTANQTADYLGIKLTQPASTVAADGTVCQAVASCLLEVSIKLWGTGRSELLPVGGPVKVQRQETPPTQDASPIGIGHNGGPPMGIGEEADPEQPPVTQGDKAGDNLADALERDLNWYLTIGDKGYYPDFSQMIMNRNLVGVAFREVYRCPIERKPLSRWVKAQDLIVQGDPSHLGAAGRVTKRTKVRQSIMLRMQANGHYRDIPLVAPTGIVSNTEIVVGQSEGVQVTPTLPRDFDHTVYECCCELGSGTAHELFGDLRTLDLDENGDDPGYPLPYRVSIDVDSRTVLAIRRNWKQGDEDHRTKRRFVKYGFIPSFGFYDWGLIHIVGNPTQAATMLQRSGVDASLYANFPAWMGAQGPASRIENTVYRPNPGEMIKFPVTAGSKLSDVLMPWPYKEPSPQSMALEQKLEGDVRRLASVIELPVGEGRIGNTPVGTIMSYIEATTQVQGAVHKDDHVAQQEEFELLRELLAEEPTVLWRGNKSPARRWQVAEELLAPDLSPKADPNTPSQIHRLMKIQGLVQLGGQQQFALGDKDGPIVNQRAIFERAAEVLAGGAAKEYSLPPQPQQAPPPDPKLVAAQLKAESEQEKAQAGLQEEAIKHQGKMQELSVEASERAADRESEETRAALSLAAVHAKSGADAANAHLDRQHQSAENATDRAHEAGMQAAEHQQQLATPPAGGETA